MRKWAATIISVWMLTVTAGLIQAHTDTYAEVTNAHPAQPLRASTDHSVPVLGPVYTRAWTPASRASVIEHSPLVHTPRETTTTTSAVPAKAAPVPRPAKKARYPEVVTRWHDLALAAGWTEKQWHNHLQCIINRESGGIPLAGIPQLIPQPDINGVPQPPKVYKGHAAHGLLQIMSTQHPEDLGDPFTNLKVGHEMYLAAGWSPWYYPKRPC